VKVVFTAALAGRRFGALTGETNMGQNSARRRRAGDFRAQIEALLAADGPALAGGTGKIVGTVHLGRVTKVHLGLSSKSDASVVDLPELSRPLYGRHGILASFTDALEKLVSGSHLRFGEVAVYFVNGVVTNVMVTARFLPGEDDEMGWFLGCGARPRRPAPEKEAAC
jgi:hypothetical protein